MTFFMIIYAIYQTTSPGVVVFPIVFFLTFVAAVDGAACAAHIFCAAQRMVDRAHHFDFYRYAALVLSFGASLLYAAARSVD